MRLAARKILKNDFEIVEAEDGEAAWDRLQENCHITLVMSDLSMPNLDGLGLLKRIRESTQPELKELPVIIVTGAEDDDGSKTTAYSAGASDFITKPFESVQLLARAQTHVRQQHTRQALQLSETSKQQLEAHSSIDLTTGLPNQRAFTDNVEEQLSYANRHKTGLALLLIRVDKYKILFLRQGKQTAESILQRITQILAEGRRREDTVARISLDTFGILLPSSTPEGAAQLARQLHKSISEETFAGSSETLSVKVSTGVASPSLQADFDAAHLLAEANRFLQQAQDAGGNCVQGTGPEPAACINATSSTAIASADEVRQALHALLEGRSLEMPADALLRAVLPIMDNWNQHHDKRYTPLLEQLKSALDSSTDNTTANTTEPDSATLFR